jgi:hypothetical protein
MKINKTIIICVLIVVIIILIVLNRLDNYDITSYLSGFWTAESKFLETSGLTQSYVYLEPMVDNQIIGFLTMIGPYSNIVSDQKIVISNIHQKNNGDGLYTLKNINVEYDNTDVMPQKLTIDIDINSGIIVLSDSEKLYAVFVKDNETTAVV